MPGVATVARRSSTPSSDWATWRYRSGRFGPFSTPSTEGSILASVAVMASFVLMGFALSIASVWVRNLLGIRAQNRMQQQMLDRILRSTWRGKARRHSGDVLNRLETDVTQVVSFLTETIPDTLSKVLLFCGACRGWSR